MTWEIVALVYFTYLALVASVRSAPDGPRRRAFGISIVLIAILLLLSRSGGLEAWLPRAAAAVLPAAVLLVGYWTSGLFFTSPMRGLEQRLLAWDKRWLEDTGVLGAYRSSPSLLLAAFELSYLLTYAMAPAGAMALAVAAPGASLNRFWVAVLAAGLGSYAALPWVQTRPPRLLGPAGRSAREASGRRHGFTRRVNLGVLDRASIGANTIPSGHAAVALTTALAVSDTLPSAGVAFLAIACGIIVATVAGRYHYAIDTVLGVALAIAAWAMALRWA